MRVHLASKITISRRGDLSSRDAAILRRTSGLVGLPGERSKDDDVRLRSVLGL